MQKKTITPHCRSAALPPLALILLALAACSQAPDTGNAIVYDGARLIIGDHTVFENGAFAVENGQITAVGAAGTLSGATVVDLSGMTVIPAIVDSHVHMSTTREDLINDLRRRAHFGVGAAMSMGSDGPDAPLELRDEVIPGIARFKSAGFGITRPEEGRRMVHWVDTVGEARQAVQAEAARNVDVVKIWVDDRDGQFEKLTPQLYGAVIEEAHQNDLRVSAHIFRQEDGKGLLRAGIDILAHGVRDWDIDEEFLRLTAANPDVVMIPNLPDRGRPTDLSWLAGSIPDAMLQELQAEGADPQVQAAFNVQSRNLRRLNDQGSITIAHGTDGNTPWGAHIEMEDMVLSGMTPGEVLVAATRNSAEVLGLDDMGTLAAGKSADFVVLEANPLDEITNTRQIESVYLRGEAVQRDGFMW